MSTPILTVSALAAVTLFMLVSLVTVGGAPITAQPSVATVEAPAHNG